MVRSSYDVIVVGGGPAGSTAAAIAARAGLRVLLLEAGTHPRIHVGESLLPGIIPILDETGALAEVEKECAKKTGAVYRGWGRVPAWDLWFDETDEYGYAWFVERARFDEILFRAAIRAGAEVRQNAAVTNLLWQGDRLAGVEGRDTRTSRSIRAESPLTIDASGQAALVARALDLRTMIQGLQHQVAWAHFEGGGRLAPPRERQAYFEAVSGQWFWYFPLSETRTSIGLVRLDDRSLGPESERERLFDEAVQGCGPLMEVAGPKLRRVTPAFHARDWSYRMQRVAGPGWLLAGDASGFIDPILSTGVHLAMHAGFHAARTARDVFAGGKSEAEAFEDYQAHHRSLFGDLLRMVRFFYQQNLEWEDYFWESKKILLSEDTELKPRRAFMVLTSGLVKNLALDERRQSAILRREGLSAREQAPTLEIHDPGHLSFICFHLHYRENGNPVPLYLLLEPRDPSTPSLFRTRNLDINCLAPKLTFRNQPLRVPEVAAQLGAWVDRLRVLDRGPAGEPLAPFWHRTRQELLTMVRAFPASFELIRVFGE